MLLNHRGENTTLSTQQHVLNILSQERRVILENSLNFSQCSAVVKKANTALGVIMNRTEYNTPGYNINGTILILHTILVTPSQRIHREYWKEPQG